MAQQYIEIENASNEEAALMFSAICEKVIKQDESEVKEMLGIPKATPPTTKDLVSLIQDTNVRCKIVVFYDDNPDKVVVERLSSKTATDGPVGETKPADLKKEVLPGDELPF